MKTAERWHRVKAIFHAAQECAPAERAHLLDQACDGDDSLRQEVESLLAADESNGDFLKRPAHEYLAEMLAVEQVNVSPGQVIGPYKILSSLGAGGMGEVYLAHDSRLGRKIALKLLAPEFARDEQRVLRFELEARAASALNHPNVCIIHEVGKTADGRHFMAMEHIEGLTLRRRMMNNGVPIKEALDIAVQIAWALAAAHAAGIVHRDIKPENIMLRSDGYVKILDFGIAKLSAPGSTLTDVHQASTIAQFQTEPGTLIGTVKYMSPEQLRELTIDDRTDIWSLAVVLHEMVTGITPFEAATNNDMIALILAKQPPDLAFKPDETPAELQQIIRRALSKRRNQRYQSIKEFAADLRRVRRQIAAAVTPPAGALPTLNIESPTNPNYVPDNEASWIGSTILEKVKSQGASTVEYVFREIKDHPRTAIFTGVLALAAIVFVGRVSPPAAPPRLSGEASFQTLKIAPLTNSGKSVCAAISPDGQLVAHAERRDGMQELVLTGLVTGTTSTLVPASGLRFRGLTFSPDGNYLYCTTGERGAVGVLHQVPLPGGGSRRIMSGVDSPIDFSPTGDRFSFVRFNQAAGEYALMLAGVDGTGERILAKRRDGNTFSVFGPAWSPDGNSIACAAGWWDNGYHMKLVEVDVGNGHERAFGEQQWNLISRVAWLPGLKDQKEKRTDLIVCAREQWTSPYQLWRVSSAHGAAVRLTNDTTQHEQVSLSRDGNTLVTVTSHQIAQVWIAPDGDERRAKAITANVGLVYGLNWTSDGRIVFSSMAGNLLNISVINADGSTPVQLTENAGDNYTPVVSPDGRFIVFASNRNGSLNIWRMNAEDGSEPKQLTFSDSNSYPACSGDGQWVVYDNQSKAAFTVWKVPIDGGSPVQIVENARMPVVSPDGQFIACRHYLSAGLKEVAIFPFRGGLPVNQVPIPIVDWQRVQWSANGRALSYIDSSKGADNIWSYDLASASTRRLTDFKSDQIYAYAWSPDHKQLACERGAQVRDVTIIRNQR